MIQTGLLVLFALATIFQVCIWQFVFRKLTPGRRPAVLENEPGISVVICARNEADNLARHLPRWLGQSYGPAWEVIVVDDASSDDTFSLLEQYAANDPRLRYFRLTTKGITGKKEALALGVQQAKHAFLLLTDADCEPAGTQWLSGMAAHFSPTVDIVLGHAPLRGNNTLIGNWSSYEAVHTAMLMGSFVHTGFPYMGIGRNLAWRKQTWTKHHAQLLKSALISGDDDLIVNAAATASNTCFCIDPETFMYSDAPETWTTWFRQKRRQLTTGPQYKIGHQIALAAVGGSWAIHYGLGLILLTAGVHVYWILGAWLIRLGIVWASQWRLLTLFGGRYLWPFVPFFDGLLAVYYGAMVPLSLLSYRPKYWK